jgi:oligopeptide/dipeptide ABC transporter ATP-binding protein
VVWKATDSAISCAVALLAIKNLSLGFARPGGVMRVVDQVSLQVEHGETVCLVGESGSGKSITALSIGRLLPSPPARFLEGEIFLDGRDVLEMKPEEIQKIRGAMVSYIFQDPGSSLNPVQRIGRQILESLNLHQPAIANPAEVIRLLALVGIADAERRYRSYPFEMSGGMQQRVVIAMALASRPKLLVADEPTTALDVTVQAQILKLLRDLQERLGMSILLITHNFGIVAQMARRVAVMYAGQIVETGAVGQILASPMHPYTMALIRAVPEVEESRGRLVSIPGQVPRPGQYPKGCRFYPRCPTARPECAEKMPELREIRPGQWARCLYAVA